MSEKHDHKHDHKHHEQQHSGRKPLHHDWRAWVVVVLMLVAMAIYVLTDNESLNGVLVRVHRVSVEVERRFQIGGQRFLLRVL